MYINNGYNRIQWGCTHLTSAPQMNKSNTKPGKHTQNHFSFRLKHCGRLLKMGVGMVFHETNRQEKHAVNHRFFTTQTMGPLVNLFWNLIIWSFFCSSWEWQIFLWWTMMRMESSAVCTGLGEPLQPLILVRLGMARPVELGRDPWPFWVLLHPPCIVLSGNLKNLDLPQKTLEREVPGIVFDVVWAAWCQACTEEFDEFGPGEWLELCEVPAFLRIKMVNVHPGDWSWKYEKQVC